MAPKSENLGVEISFDYLSNLSDLQKSDIFLFRQVPVVGVVIHGRTVCMAVSEVIWVLNAHHCLDLCRLRLVMNEVGVSLRPKTDDVSGCVLRNIVTL